MPRNSVDRFGRIVNKHLTHEENWRDLTDNPDPRGSVCAPCGDEEGPFCEGCGACGSCCNCSPSDCDCDVCEERRAYYGGFGPHGH